MHRTFSLWIVVALLQISGNAAAATITVTGTANTIAVDGSVTLAEAIASINAGSNTNADVVASGSYGTNDTIAFAIPGAGAHTILVDSALVLNKPAKIDGYTQPGASANTNGPAQGSNANLQIQVSIQNLGAFALYGGSSVIQGLVINGNSLILRNFGGNTIAGNFFGTDPAGAVAAPQTSPSVVADVFIDWTSPNNTIGGTTPAARNVISGGGNGDGIYVSSSGNTIQGNLIGTNAAGNAALPNYYGIGISLGGADNNVIGGTTAAARNVVSGNTMVGIEIDTLNNQVQGNYVGTDVTGSLALGNGTWGISIGGGSNEVIGGTAPGAGNVVSGNGVAGIVIPYGISGITVTGNFIGTDASGTQAVCGHSMAGIEVSGGNNTIGGSAAGAANIIAFNKGDGVRVDGQTGNAISRNSIFSNANGGIRLGSNGPNTNDPGDTDNGPNGFQNFPVLSVAGVGSSGFDIGATLDSHVGVYHFEFFANKACGYYGRGEGRTFIGSADVASDATGITQFPAQLFAAPSDQPAISATATDSAGDTSEFSVCLDDRIFANSFEPPPPVCL
jgi:titin